MSSKQKTIKSKVVFEGIGIHSGVKSKITLIPSNENTGIIIRNPLFKEHQFIIGKTIPKNSNYATVLECSKWHVSTIEHVMATLVMLDIDNLIIEVEGFEFPILDGSSLPFIEKIKKCGIVVQNSLKQHITPRHTIIFEDKDEKREIVIEPMKNELAMDIFYDARFENVLKEKSVYKSVISSQNFITDIAPARTFGYLNQLPFMKKHGLAQGASLENTLVIGNEGYINTYRFENECVRHKVLDLIGDLALLGKKFVGSIKAKKTGHSFNRNVIKHFLDNPEAWIVF